LVYQSSHVYTESAEYTKPHHLINSSIVDNGLGLYIVFCVQKKTAAFIFIFIHHITGRKIEKKKTNNKVSRN